MISLIATVLNEGDNIRHLFDSIKAQTRPPDEIVIVDGGSSDDTLAIMQGYAEELPLRLFVEAGCNISQGRNRAIAGAKGEIIAVTDAGLRLREDWLEKITAPLLSDADLQVAGGFFLADPQTAFELALGATTLPLAREIDGASFLPSSRSIAFRKAAAEAIGGYPEWLDFCEDLVFDLRLRERGAAFAFAPDASSYFFVRGRVLRQFFRQYYLYARGDGKANLWFKRHLIRYLTYFALTPGIFVAGALIHPALWLLYLIGVADYLYLPCRRLPAVMRRAPERAWHVWLYCIIMIPLIRFSGDVAKMIGYPVGWRWRLARRPPDWRGAE